MGRWGAGRWLHLTWSSAYTHDALLGIGLGEPSCPVPRVGVLSDNASRELGPPEHNVASWFEHVGGSELKNQEVIGGGAVEANGSRNRSGQAFEGFLGRGSDLAPVEGHGKDGSEDHLYLGASVPWHVCKPQAKHSGIQDSACEGGGRHGTPHV